MFHATALLVFRYAIPCQPFIQLPIRIGCGTKYDKVRTSTFRYILFRPSFFSLLRTFVVSSMRGPCEEFSGDKTSPLPFPRPIPIHTD